MLGTDDNPGLKIDDACGMLAECGHQLEVRYASSSSFILFCVLGFCVVQHQGVAALFV